MRRRDFLPLIGGAAPVLIGTLVCASGVLAQSGVVDYSAIVGASDRNVSDRQLDHHRDPAKWLAFAAPQPGMKVLDMGAGNGLNRPGFDGGSNC